MTTRVYKYGAVLKSKCRKMALSNFFRANRLWNELVAIHNDARDKYENLPQDLDADAEADKKLGK